MICGGSEAAITPLGMAGFCAMRAVSLRNDEPALASRPWDRDRDGFVLGEGAGVLVIEEREHALLRGAKPIAELIGYGRNSDAYHANAPLESGDGVRRAMELALADASISPSDIAYLNAHATSTLLGDRAEAAAIRSTFRDHARELAVSSTKSMTGHLLGGAGSLEAGFTVLALRDQIAPPTINLECPDIDYGLDFVPMTARPLSMRHAMTNSFGFGGGNASLIFRTFD
jgi:3-oxoacyl-[acyl-carrier-protein] synthase II